MGGGYVGLVSAVCLAELGHHVNLIEIDKSKVDLINSSRPPIYEKDLDHLLAKHTGWHLEAFSDYSIVAESDITIICVGTPSDFNGNANLSMIKSASESVGDSLADSNRYHVVVVKSTVPPGTTENIVQPEVLDHSCKELDSIGICMNPEFLREGLAIHDFMHPDRIVIGSRDGKAGDLLESIYKDLNSPIVRTSISAAEMIKYASNAFLATKISFSNEIGNICKKLGIDVYEVMKGVGLDPRISPLFLNAGAGFGGSCFPKDVRALIQVAEAHGENPVILKSVMEVNENQPLRMVELMERKVGELKGKRIAVLGLAFKNDTDDIRESRSIPVIAELRRRGAKVSAYDPLANSTMRQIFQDIEYHENAASALKNADGCMIMTEWQQFASLDEEFESMRSRVIIEGRRVLSCRGVDGICW